MRYLSNTGPEQRAMLDTIGASTLEELLARVPAKARLTRPLDLKAAAAEMDLVREMKTLAAMNADAESYACFLGAGSYDHFTPTVINLLCFWLMEIPLAYVLAWPARLGPAGVFWSIAIASSALAVVSAFAFKRGGWKSKHV